MRQSSQFARTPLSQPVLLDQNEFLLDGCSSRSSHQLVIIPGCLCLWSTMCSAPARSWLTVGLSHDARTLCVLATAFQIRLVYETILCSSIAPRYWMTRVGAAGICHAPNAGVICSHSLTPTSLLLAFALKSHFICFCHSFLPISAVLTALCAVTPCTRRTSVCSSSDCITSYVLQPVY